MSKSNISSKPQSGSWNCIVCRKTYTQSRAHTECFKTFCRVCREQFDSEDAYRLHCEFIHEDNYCETCNVVVLDISQHNCGKKS